MNLFKVNIEKANKIGVALVAGLLLSIAFFGLVFLVLGVWPPFMSVVSGSMEPNINQGSVVIGKEIGRFESSPKVDTYLNSSTISFGKPGDIVAYEKNTLPVKEQDSNKMILHRVMFHVEEGENWINKANREYLPPGKSSCSELKNCPAPHSGYITKGDANKFYDQVGGISTVVKTKWMHSEVLFVIPGVGYIYLLFILALLGIVFFTVVYFFYLGIREIVVSVKNYLT